MAVAGTLLISWLSVGTPLLTNATWAVDFAFWQRKGRFSAPNSQSAGDSVLAHRDRVIVKLDHFTLKVSYRNVFRRSDNYILVRLTVASLRALEIRSGVLVASIE